MIKRLLAACAVVCVFAAPALADPIEGNWRTQSGETASISPCGGAYCITLKSGAHAGKQIGKMSPSGGKYTGSITDPADDKTYSGSAQPNGSNLKMTGCALKIFCRSQTWSRM